MFRNRLHNKSNVVWGYILFLLWPAIACITAIKNFNIVQLRPLLILFFGFFGYTIVINDASDSSRHLANFKQTSLKPFSEFFNVVTGLYKNEGVKPDFIMDLVNFTVSRFTDNPQIYFLVLALLIGWILVKNLEDQYEVYKANKNALSLLFIFFIVILVPPFRMVSFRHYFALVVYVYAVYRYFQGNNSFYLLLIASTVFIHFGFALAVGLLLLYKVLGNRNMIYFALIILSVLFHEQAAAIIRQYGLGVDIGIEQAVKGYTNESYLENISEIKSNSNVLITKYIRFTTVYFLITIVFYKWRLKKIDNTSEKLFSFLLLFFSFINFTQDIGSITDRFSILFQVLSCVFFVGLFAKNVTSHSVVFKYITIVVMAVNAIVITRISMEYANILLITPLSPFAFFLDIDYTLLDLIK